MEATKTDDLARALELLPPIFARCLDEPGGRWGTDLPFVAGDHLYATNGQMAVRVPTPAGWDFPNLGRVPLGIGQLFEGEYRGEPSPLPDVKLSACPECKGTGTLPERPCEDCEGRGKIDHDCDCEYCTASKEDCEDCGGEGRLEACECEECDGTGSGEDTPVPVGDGFLWDRFVALLREFDARVYLSSAGPRSGVPARFVAGQVEGLVATISAPRED